MLQSYKLIFILLIVFLNSLFASPAFLSYPLELSEERNSNSIDLNLGSLYYASEFERKKYNIEKPNLIQAKKAKIDLSFLIDIAPEQGKDYVDIYIDETADKIILKSPIVSYAHPKSDIAFINNLNLLSGEDIQMLFQADRASANVHKFDLKYNTMKLDFKDSKLDCSTYDPSQDLFKNFSKVCINNLKGNANFTVKTEDTTVKGEVDSLVTTENKFKIKAPEFMIGSSWGTFGLDDFTATCQKDLWDMYNLDHKGIVKGCLTNSNLIIDNVYYNSFDRSTMVQFLFKQNTTGSRRSLILDSEQLSLSGDLLGKFGDYKLALKNIEASCSKIRNENGAFEYAHLYQGCLKESNLLIDSMEFYNSQDKAKLRITADLDHLRADKEKYSLKGGGFNVRAGAHVFTVPEFDFSCKKYKPEQKEEVTTHVLKSCLYGSEFKLPSITYKNSQIKTRADVKIKELDLNQIASTLLADHIKVKYEDMDINFDDISVKCKKLIYSNFDFKEFGYDRCFHEAALKMRSFTLNDPGKTEIRTYDPDQSRRPEATVFFDIDQDKFHFKTPYAFLKLDTTNINLHDLNISCKRLKDENGDPLKPYDPKFLEGCFDSSELLISKAKIGDSVKDLSLDINNLKIDRKHIEINLPTASYSTGDKSAIILENVAAYCRLDANMKILEVFDWETLLTNCVSGAKITIRRINEREKGKQAKKHAEKLKFETFLENKVQRFKLTLKVDVSLFLGITVPVTKTFDGRIRYVPHLRTLKFRLDSGDIFDNLILSLFGPSFIEKDGRSIYIKL